MLSTAQEHNFNESFTLFHEEVGVPWRVRLEREKRDGEEEGGDKKREKRVEGETERPQDSRSRENYPLMKMKELARNMSELRFLGRERRDQTTVGRQLWRALGDAKRNDCWNAWQAQ